MSDRLPPKHVPVLIYAGGTACVAEFQPDVIEGLIFWGAVGFGGYEWEWNWQSNTLPWCGVTHWMPVPDSPS